MGAPLGNTNAASAREWRQALQRAMARKAEGDYRKTLDDVAERVIDAALAGEKDAWKEIGDRMDGKPAQAIVGETDQPLRMVIGWAIPK